MATAAPSGVRVYVGGLPADTSEAELRERFSRFAASGSCRLERVELLPPKGLFALDPTATHRGFAYLTLCGADAAEITEKLVKTYHKTKWRGSVLRVEAAKPDFMARLQQEWQEQREREQLQCRIMAEARGLVTSIGPRDVDALEVNVGGVEFRGKKRTTFEYEDIDFEAAFAPKPAKQTVVVALPPVAQAEEPLPETETESSGDEQQQAGDDDDDADYWATSGDESEKAGADKSGELSAESSDGSEQEDEDESEDADEENADEEMPTEDAVAVDDVEAFVQQMLEQEADENAQASDESASPNKPVGRATTAISGDSAQLEEDGVDAFVQQVEREEANARRIAALEAKMKQKQQQQQQQAAAVKIDISAKSNKKITFDDSGNEQEENDEGGEGGDGADGSGAITNWLDSSDDEGGEKEQDYGELRDGSDDDEDDRMKKKKRNAFEFAADDDDDAKAFAVRPEFLGERGKKLFELQKRFGGDQRFRMDARFIDDEENEYGGTDGLLPDIDDDEQVIAAIAEGPTGELQEFQDEDGEDQAAANEREWMAEQDLALSVIAELFPDVDIENIKYRMRVKIKKDPIKEASWMGQMMRYDPRDIHARHAYEIPIEDQKTKLQGVSGGGGGDDSDVEDTSAADEEKKKRKAREEKEVLIGGDRFFSTSNSLGSLFTRVRKNSEDGIAGEAALDGVFGFSRGFDDAAATGGDAAGNAGDSAAAAPGAGGATFKLSSLFDFPVDEDKEKNSRLAAMGEKLFEDENNDDEEDKPWHFTQSFFSDERDDAHMDTDNEDEDDGEEADEAENEDAAEDDGKKKKKKVVLKKSLSEFLAFAKTFVCPQDGSTNQKSKEWTEKRKRLTLDFKRKRKDALRNKKKMQQRMQKQHQNKKQKTAR